MQAGIWQVLIVAALVLLLFGRGRVSEMMGDVGKGISSFKKGLSDEGTDQAKANPPAQIDNKSAEVAADTNQTTDKTVG